MAGLTSAPQRPITEVQRTLRWAADEQLTQVVALLDAMPIRGNADALIAPLRSRLASIAPVRPLSIIRLLFRPLDPVITTGPRWRPGAPAVPRTALLGIGNAVFQQLGPIATPIQAIIAGREGKDQAVVEQAGAILWPQAAIVVADLPIPADWASATGLPGKYYPEIRANITAVLRQAVPLAEWTRRSGPADPALVVKAILAGTRSNDPAGLGIVLAVMLADGGLAASALLAASTLPGGQVDRAVEQSLDQAQYLLSAVLPSVGLAGAAAQVMQVAALLDALQASGVRPALRRETQRIRQLADAACQDRVLQALNQEFLPRLAAADSVVDDAALSGLECVARGLRRMSLIGRRLGTGAAYEKLLGRTAAEVCTSETSTLTRMERLRLAELLIGPDAALQLLPA